MSKLLGVALSPYMHAAAHSILPSALFHCCSLDFFHPCLPIAQPGAVVVVHLRAQDNEESERKRIGCERRWHIWRRTERKQETGRGWRRRRNDGSENESERCKKQGDSARCFWMVMYVGEGHMGWPTYFLLLPSSISFSFLLFFLLHADVLHFLTFVWHRLASCLTCQSGNAVLSRLAFRRDNHDIFTAMSIYHNVFISTSRGTTRVYTLY